jgi:hypothetical protein
MSNSKTYSIIQINIQFQFNIFVINQIKQLKDFKIIILKL